MLRPTAAAALLTVALAFPLTAQLSEVQPGARVRIEAPGTVAGKYEGTVLSRSADTLVLGAQNSVPIRVPFARISSLEISRGTSRADGAIRGMKWGVPIMAAAGGAVALAAVSGDSCAGAFGGTLTGACTVVTTEAAIAFTGLAALGGAVYGAGIGALIGRERWDSFDLSQRTSLHVERSHGRLGFGLELGF